MPLQAIATNDRAFHGEVMSAGHSRRVWLFRVLEEPPRFVLAVEGSACLSFVPGEREITGLDLVTAGCDLLLAQQVITLLQETLPHASEPFYRPLRGLENRPIEGNQPTT